MPLRRSMLAIRVARRAAAELDAFSALLSASESFSALAIPMTLWTAPRALHCLRDRSSTSAGRRFRILAWSRVTDCPGRARNGTVVTGRWGYRVNDIGN